MDNNPNQPSQQPTVKKVNEDRVLELEQEKEELNNQIAGLKEQLTDPEKDKLSIEQFLNLTVDTKKVLSYQLKPHFEEMLKSKQQRTSRGREN